MFEVYSIRQNLVNFSFEYRISQFLTVIKMAWAVAYYYTRGLPEPV